MNEEAPGRNDDIGHDEASGGAVGVPDLGGEAGVDSADAEIEVIEPIEGVGADLEGRREWVRAAIALSLVAIFGITVFASLAVLAWADMESDRLKTLLEILLPAETALLGSAVGFYYGAEARNSS